MPRPQDNRRLIDLPHGEFARRITRKGIGGTDIEAIVGLSRYSSRQEVWEKKMGIAPERVETVDMRRGKILERIAAEEYALATGRSLRPKQKVQHPDIEWAIGSPDREIFAEATGHEPRVAIGDGNILVEEAVAILAPIPNAPAEGNGILEIKSLRLDGFYRTREEGINPGYYCQLQWYLGNGGYKWGAFAVFNAEDWALHEFDVVADPEFYNWMLGHASVFWMDHVLTRTAPNPAAPTMPDELRARVRERSGATTTDVEHAEHPAREEWRRRIEAMLQAREAHTLADRRKTLAEDAVKAYMDEYEVDGVRGFGASISYREQSSRRLDRDALAEAHPELDLEPFMRASVSRPFRVTLRGAGDTRTRRGASSNPERPAQDIAGRQFTAFYMDEPGAHRALMMEEARIERRVRPVVARNVEEVDTAQPLRAEDFAGLRGLEGAGEESAEIAAAAARPDGVLPVDGDEAVEAVDAPTRPSEGAQTAEPPARRARRSRPR